MTSYKYANMDDALIKKYRKVGIITFHWAHNYGAVLQAYALCQYIKTRLKHEPCIIDFRTFRQQKVNTNFKWPPFNRHFVKAFGVLLLRLLRIKALRKRSQRFSNFIKENLTCSRHLSTYNELNSSKLELDAVVSGSDQVFNAEILPHDELLAYLLIPFAASKFRLIAYAPSFGNTDLSQETKKEISKPLQDFHFLSAREAPGQRLLQELTGKSIPLVLDPVFLVSRQAWMNIASQVKAIPKPYILCYALNGREALGGIANKVKSILNIPIVMITAKVRNRIKADVALFDVGPREFVWLFENANFVVTDSFHGTAFSILFEKDFYTQIALPRNSQRIIGLLNQIKLSNRIINDADIDITAETLKINYSFPNQIIQRLKAESESYLSKSLCWQSANK